MQPSLLHGVIVYATVHFIILFKWSTASNQVIYSSTNDELHIHGAITFVRKQPACGCSLFCSYCW